MTNRYEGIIKTQNEKAIGYNGKQGQLFKKFKDTEHFCNNVGHSRSTTYFKYLFINYWRNTLCFKNPSYSQFILKIIINLSRLFAKKAQLLWIDHWNCFNILQRGKFWGIFVDIRFYVSLLFFTFPFTNNFFLSWEFSLKLRLFSWFENFPLCWEFSLELRIFT